MSRQDVTIAEFVTACVERAGGLAETREDGLVEALVPEDLRGEFPDRELIRFATEPKAAARYPDALPALAGSQPLDSLVHYALRQGRITEGFPHIETLRPRNLAPEIIAALKFTARRVRLPEDLANVETASVAQFDFIVSFDSDEKDERLQSVVIDLWSGLASAPLTRIAPDLAVDDSGARAGRRVRITLEEAYGAARSALAEWLAPRVVRYQVLITRRLQDEYGRLSLYYAAMVDDLERRIARADGAAERQQALRQKIEATQTEQSSKLAELGEKYRLRPSARLAAVRELTYPCLFSSVLLDRRQGSRELEVCWDPLIGRVRPPACERCGRETAHVHLDRERRLICSACATLEEAAGNTGRLDSSSPPS